MLRLWPDGRGRIEVRDMVTPQALAFNQLLSRARSIEASRYARAGRALTIFERLGRLFPPSHYVVIYVRAMLK